MSRAEDIKDLRRRHHITQKQLADSLYGIKFERIADWESINPKTGKPRRNCPDIVWWAMKLTWDKVDLWEGEGE